MTVAKAIQEALSAVPCNWNVFFDKLKNDGYKEKDIVRVLAKLLKTRAVVNTPTGLVWRE